MPYLLRLFRNQVNPVLIQRGIDYTVYLTGTWHFFKLIVLLKWIIGYICTLESGMFTVNGYTISFNFTTLKTQYTLHTMDNFVGLMNATLSVKFLLQEGFCPPMFIHGRVFVRPLWKWREGFYPGGVLSVFHAIVINYEYNYEYNKFLFFFLFFPMYYSFCVFGITFEVKIVI